MMVDNEQHNQLVELDEMQDLTHNTMEQTVLHFNEVLEVSDLLIMLVSILDEVDEDEDTIEVDEELLIMEVQRDPHEDEVDQDIVQQTPSTVPRNKEISELVIPTLLILEVRMMRITYHELEWVTTTTMAGMVL